MKSFAETEDFQKKLCETGGYKTDPERARPMADRLLGRFDTWYYRKIFRIVYSGHCLSVRGEFDTKQWAVHAYSLMSAVEECGGRVEISGMEHPAALGRPAVYVGNHMSMVESFSLPVMLTPFNYLAVVIKEDLLKYPLFGSIMRAIEPISVGRRNPREDLKNVLVQGRACLESGRSVMIFPQATRSAVFDPSALNSLGVKLAKKAGVPVIPLALKTDFQGNGRIVKDIGPLDRSKTVYFRFGPPLEVKGNGRETHESVVRFIVESLKAWGTRTA